MYWRSRNPVRHGLIDPPRLGRIHTASTAVGRMHRRVQARITAAGFVQVQLGMVTPYERRPWRILGVDPIDYADWPDDFRDRYRTHIAAARDRQITSLPAVWRGRPVRLRVTPVTGPDADVVHTLIHDTRLPLDILGEHYALCRACGELPPCRDELIEQQMVRRMALAEERLAIPPGHCLGCGEEVTARQRALRIGGPNLWRPDLGDASAVFHSRQDCADVAEQYRQDAKRAGIGMHPGSLLSDLEDGGA